MKHQLTVHVNKLCELFMTYLKYNGVARRLHVKPHVKPHVSKCEEIVKLFRGNSTWSAMYVTKVMDKGNLPQEKIVCPVYLLKGSKICQILMLYAPLQMKAIDL